MNKKRNDGLLWSPSLSRVEASRLSEFRSFASERSGTTFESYEQLHQWSVGATEPFWQATWDFV
ncbi:MAG: hypothetical protein AAF991_06265, partial [Pseudomonadota bacterium]